MALVREGLVLDVVAQVVCVQPDNQDTGCELQLIATQSQSNGSATFVHADLRAERSLARVSVYKYRRAVRTAAVEVSTAQL